MAYIDKDKIPYYLDTSENAPIEGRKIAFKSDIDKIPTADVEEVKHGEWEKFEIPHMMRCSECGVSDLDIHRTKFAFCPNCGAKMDGGSAE